MRRNSLPTPWRSRSGPVIGTKVEWVGAVGAGPEAGGRTVARQGSLLALVFRRSPTHSAVAGQRQRQEDGFHEGAAGNASIVIGHLLLASAL
jgi:hypothetical protein